MVLYLYSKTSRTDLIFRGVVQLLFAEGVRMGLQHLEEKNSAQKITTTSHVV